MELSSSTDILPGVDEGIQFAKNEEDTPKLNRFATVDPSQLARSESRKATFYRVAAVTAMVAFAVIFLGAVVVASTFASPAVALGVAAAASLIYFKGVHGLIYEKLKNNSEIASRTATQNQSYHTILSAIEQSKPGDQLSTLNAGTPEQKRISAMALHWKVRAANLIKQLEPLEQKHHDLTHLLYLNENLPNQGFGEGDHEIARQRNALLKDIMKEELSEAFTGNSQLPQKNTQLLAAKQANICNQINQIKEADLYSAIIQAAFFDYLLAHMEDKGVLEDLGSFNAKNLTGHGVAHFTPKSLEGSYFTFKSGGGLQRKEITPERPQGLSSKIAALSDMIATERAKQVAGAKKGSKKAA